MSKSKGNVIDPISITEKYGTDAFRIAIIIGNTPGTSLALSENKIKAYRNFANKIWNASKFVLENTKDFKEKKLTLDDWSKKNIKILKTQVKDITEDLENYRFYLAAEKNYHYFWHTFCDKIIEESKERLKSENKTKIETTKYVLLEILTTCLKTLHPFMPFITEEIYQKIPIKKKEKFLMIEYWPKT